MGFERRARAAEAASTEKEGEGGVEEEGEQEIDLLLLSRSSSAAVLVAPVPIPILLERRSGAEENEGEEWRQLRGGGEEEKRLCWSSADEEEEEEVDDDDENHGNSSGVTARTPKERSSRASLRVEEEEERASRTRASLLLTRANACREGDEAIERARVMPDTLSSLSHSLLFLSSYLSLFLSLPTLAFLASLTKGKKAHHGRHVGRRRGRPLLRVHRSGGGARLQLCVVSFFPLSFAFIIVDGIMQCLFELALFFSLFPSLSRSPFSASSLRLS